MEIGPSAKYFLCPDPCQNPRPHAPHVLIRTHIQPLERTAVIMYFCRSSNFNIVICILSVNITYKCSKTLYSVIHPINLFAYMQKAYRGTQKNTKNYKNFAVAYLTGLVLSKVIYGSFTFFWPPRKWSGIGTVHKSVAVL